MNSMLQEKLTVAISSRALFNLDESHAVFQNEGVEAYCRYQVAREETPLVPGVAFGLVKKLLALLHRIQLDYPADQSPIRTALITARAAPAHERVIRTLRAWNIRIDEALFLGGMEKGAFLKAFGADIFFDDQQKHCESARQHVATGHVPHGVANEG